MLSHLKKRLGVLTAIAVLSALVPVLAASPASAAPSATLQLMADGANLSACPASASIPSAGFTDTTSTDVDCIKYYGVTTGVTATTYEPAASVSRWEMALFLTRLADVSGITLGSGADQGFTDISGKSTAIQTAINQIKQLGVTTGKTATTYAPDDNVSREEMAMFIERLGTATTAGPGGTSSNTAAGVATTYINYVTTATYSFTDIDAGDVTYEGHNSIVELWHMGITDLGHYATAYRPADTMTRAEMATFMTNFLAHTNARPTGLVLQATSYSDWGTMVAATDQLHVSNRDASFDGIADTVVDVFGFQATTTLNEAAFASTGACKDALEADASGTEELCLMENSDYVTDQSGNISILSSSLAAGVKVDAEAESVQYWAWTAAIGTYYSSAETSSTVTMTSKRDGDVMHWASSHPYANAVSYVYDGTNTATCHEAKFGSDVTITLQLKDATGTTNYNTAKSGVRLNVNDAQGTGGSAGTSMTNTVITSDADGAGTYVASMADPSTSATNIKFQVLTFSDGSNATYGVTTVGAFTTGAANSSDTSVCLKWEDVARDETTVVTSVASAYTTATAVGSGATNTVTGTAYDQYGVGIASSSLGLTTSTLGTGSASAATFTTTRTTNSSGVATFAVARDAATTAKSTFRVNDNEDNNASKVVYWTVAPAATVLDTGVAGSASNVFAPGGLIAACADGTVGGDIVVIDTANDVFVVDINHYDNTSACTNTYVKYTYDSNDAFFIAGSAQTYAAFDYAMSIKTASATVLTTPAPLYDGSNNGKLSVAASTGYASEFRIVS
jgi:hypothetical protein